MVRPTTDLAREALFNILNNRYDFEETVILDLFCGTGAVSYEFISRGSYNVTAVDVSTRCTSFVKATVEQTGMRGLHVITADAFYFLEKSTEQWDIIFADPPYMMKESRLLPGLIRKKKLLKPEGCLIIEHPAEINFSEEEGFAEMRKYGRVHFSFFRF